MSYNIQPGTEDWPDDMKLSPSYAKQNRKFHIHRTSAWQDPTGQNRYALCGASIGPVGREVTLGAIRRSKYWNRICKTCIKLFNANGQ
jgi:hypothetical protein